MASDQQPTRACTGCLGTEECWICTGEGCHRCTASGRCHLCAATERELPLVPPQATAAGRRHRLLTRSAQLP